MNEPRKYKIDEVRENLYILAVMFEEKGNKKWAGVLDQAREYLLELEQLKKV